ncbi:MAG: hypothetical protein IPL90_11080 [Holophagales bacterium]|nr:hypothetical protein [Holophagales bacterium]
MTYLLPGHEPSAAGLVALHRWTHREALPNPVVIPPALLAWSSLFHPRFFAATDAERDGTPRVYCRWPADAPRTEDLARFRLQSTLFLAGVTLSAAIVQSGIPRTMASKYDHLWEAGLLARAGTPLPSCPRWTSARVRELVADTGASDVERLLALRRQFLAAWTLIAPESDVGAGEVEQMSASALPEDLADRFGFVPELCEVCGPDLQAVIAYGSSLSKFQLRRLRRAAGRGRCRGAPLQACGANAPRWRGKEINVGVYASDELIAMQRLSGDNLKDYGLCLWGRRASGPEASLPRGTSALSRAARQQLGMLSRALGEAAADDGDDRQPLRVLRQDSAKHREGLLGRSASAGPGASADLDGLELRFRCRD